MAIAEEIAQGIMPTALTTLYTFNSTNAGSRRIVRYIYIVNGDESNYVTWYLYKVKPGETAGQSNRIAPGTTQFRVKPGKGQLFNIWSVLHPNYTIQGYCDNGNVNYFIEGAKESK